VVNAKNAANKRKLAEADALAARLEAEVRQWQGLRDGFTGRAADEAAEASAALDDGSADAEAAGRFGAAASASELLAELADRAEVAVGAVAEAAKGATAAAEDANSLVRAAGAGVHTRAFGDVAKGAPGNAAALIRGLGGADAGSAVAAALVRGSRGK